MANEYIDLVDEQLRNSKTIAVVGLSNNPDRDSHRVASYMQSQGLPDYPGQSGDRRGPWGEKLP